MIKPSITPRDDFVVIGNTLYTPNTPQPQWADALREYRADPGSSVKPGAGAFVSGANIVRVGRDLIIDTGYAPGTVDNIDVEEYSDYRLHIVQNFWHLYFLFSIFYNGFIFENFYLL